MTEPLSADVQDPAIELDSVAAFAADLRDLRSSAGDPTLAALSTRTGISKSVLSVALSGRGLPTERTVIKLVAELSGDPALWRARRESLDPRLSQFTTSRESKEPTTGRRFSPLQVLMIAVTTAVITAVATSAIWGFGATGDTASASSPENASGPYVAAANGVDPMRTECKDDAVIAASEARLDNQVHVQLLYSNDCLAVWGRVTRYDGESDGNSMTMRIWPMDQPDSTRNQSRTGEDLQSLYTPMIIEPDVEARICGQATVTVDGRTEDLGPQLCI